MQREQALTQLLQPLRVPGLGSLQEIADVTVREPGGGSHHALEEPRAGDAAVVAHAQFAAQAQPVLVRDQRAQAVGKFLREHRQHAIREVHGRAALARLHVQRAAGLHVVADVGDRHDHPPAAARPIAEDRIVVVARILPVDGDEFDPAQVFAPGDRRLRNPRAVGAGLGEDLVGEGVGQAVRVDRDLGLHARGAVHAEQPGHASDRLRVPAGLLRDLDDDDLAGLGPAELRLRHQHAMRDARIVRGQVGDARLDVQPAHHLARAPLQHLDDRALRLALEMGTLDAHGRAITVEDLAHLLRRQVDGGRGIVGKQPAVAVALRLDRAHHQSGHLLAQAVLSAAVLHGIATLHQGDQLRLGVCAGHGTQHLDHLLEAQRAACPTQAL